LVVSEDVFSRLDTVRIVKAAGNYADLVAHRTSKGERATTTWTEAPLDLSRRRVFRQVALGPKQIVRVKRDKNKEGRTRLPLTPAAVAVSYPKRIAPALKAKVSTQASASDRHSFSCN
jgi:translation initiation factor 1 (eIF-1/SUI1)